MTTTTAEPALTLEFMRTLTAGTYTIEATTFLGGVTGPFTLSVVTQTETAPFTDDPIVPGETPVRAVHFTELRARIDGARAAVGLGRLSWTDSTLLAGITPVRGVHMSELRIALAEAYGAVGATTDFSTEAVQVGWEIRAWHINEVRRAVETLERVHLGAP